MSAIIPLYNVRLNLACIDIGHFQDNAKLPKTKEWLDHVAELNPEARLPSEAFSGLISVSRDSWAGKQELQGREGRESL